MRLTRPSREYPGGIFADAAAKNPGSWLALVKSVNVDDQGITRGKIVYAARGYPARLDVIDRRWCNFTTYDETEKIFTWCRHASSRGW